MLTLEYVFPQLPPSEPIAEIVQQQWRGNLNIAVRLVRQDFQAWIEKFETGDFEIDRFRSWRRLPGPELVSGVVHDEYTFQGRLEGSRIRRDARRG